MPMLYGEGSKAFIRLQHEIIKSSSDQSIFVWDPWSLPIQRAHIFAPSAFGFRNAGQVQHLDEYANFNSFALSNVGLSISLPVKSQAGSCYAALNCCLSKEIFTHILIHLRERVSKKTNISQVPVYEIERHSPAEDEEIQGFQDSVPHGEEMEVDAPAGPEGINWNHAPVQPIIIIASLDSKNFLSQLNRISPVDLNFEETKFSNSKQQHLRGTFEWFLHNSRFQSLTGGHVRAMHCTGTEGPGQTVLAHMTSMYLQNRYWNRHVAVLTVHCTAAHAYTQTAIQIVAALLRRALELGQAFRGDVKITSDSGVIRSHLDQARLADKLQVLLLTFELSFIVLDGLDEIADKREMAAMRDVLDESGEHVPSLRILTFSRGPPLPSDLAGIISSASSDPSPGLCMLVSLVALPSSKLALGICWYLTLLVLSSTLRSTGEGNRNCVCLLMGFLLLLK